MRIAIAGGTGTVGRHVADVCIERGLEHDILTRSTGVDLVAGTGLDGRLDGVTAVIDVSSTFTLKDAESEAFFGPVTANLLREEQAAGVGHHLALGIVGSLDAPVGYYAGKALQERLIEQASVPFTILRATQFHEFAAMLLGQVRVGPVSLVPRMRSQTVAARTVAERLVDLATQDAAGHVPDLAGPRPERMLHLVRAYARHTGHRGPILEVPLPGPYGRAMRDGTLLPGPGADLSGPDFGQWLASR